MVGAPQAAAGQAGDTHEGAIYLHLLLLLLLILLLLLLLHLHLHLHLQVAEPTTGGEGVVAVYESLKERIEAAQGAAMEQGAPEEPAAPF